MTTTKINKISQKEKLHNLIRSIENLHPNDPRFSDYSDEIVELLSEDYKISNILLESLSESEIKWITPAFSQISARLQSKEFIDCIKRITQKYPAIVGGDGDVQDAIEAMD